MRKDSFQFFLRSAWPSGVRKDIFWSSSTATGALEREKVISEGNLGLRKAMRGSFGRGERCFGVIKIFMGLMGGEPAGWDQINLFGVWLEGNSWFGVRTALLWASLQAAVLHPIASSPPAYGQVLASSLWMVLLDPMDGSP